MKKALKAVALILTFIIVITNTIPVKTQAAQNPTPGIPKISVKKVNNGADLKVTIKKTEDAVGYEVWMTTDVAYKGYKNVTYEFKYSRDDINTGDFINAATVEKNGTKKRSIIIKNIPSGKLSVKVRAYSGIDYDEFGNEIRTYGEFSKVKKVVSDSPVEIQERTHDFSKVKKGDVIEFGAYEQDYPIDGKDPIEWTVLEKNGDELLLLSKYGLDFVPYNDVSSNATWEECSLRKWLNEEFYESAFDESEKKMIKTYTIRNEENPRMAYYMDTNENVYETDEGNPTEVKVFPLTVDELLNTDYGFSADADAEDDNRKCLLTDYALAQGTNFYEKYNKNIKHYSQWGLRTVGYLYQAAVAAVHKNGDVSKSGHGKADISLAIRPAIYVTIA